MFEHLDDPSQEINPGARELAMVSRRAERISTRRRWTATVGFCCVLLAASVGFFVARPASKQPATSTADYQFNLLQGKLAIGLPVPTTALVDVGFADEQDGFALAVHRNEVLLAATTDGGTSWRVRNDDLPSGLGANSGYPGQFEFVGTTGYLWGARSTGGAPLWVSHDDGVSWQPALIGPFVLDVSAIGPDVWAVTSFCPTASPTASVECSMGVEQSLDGGTTWSALRSPAAIVDAPAGIGLWPVELARITKTRAYLLSEETPGPANDPAWTLSFTADAGVTWTSRPVPCNAPFSLGAEVAASSTEDMWLLCGGQGAAGEQSKELFRSSSGGQSWSLVASATGVGPPGSGSVPHNPLPIAGYIAPITEGHRNLAVASPTTAWLYPSRASLFVTSDGGSTWDQVPELGSSGFAGGGEGNITFLSPTHGWICAYGAGLWQTTDGVHWHAMGIG